MEANAARQATPAEWGQGAPGSYSQKAFNLADQVTNVQIISLAY